MEKLSVRKKQNIVKLYLSGMSYDEIAPKTGVSKSSVGNIIAEFKAGAFPEAADIGEQVELLRELSIELKRSNLSPGQCAAGLKVIDRIRECGMTPSDINRLPMILKTAGSEEDTREFIGAIRSIQDVMKRTGLSIGNLDSKVHQLEKKASELESVVKKRDDCRRQLAEMEGRCDELNKLVSGNQEKYNLLVPRVKDLEKREQDLLSRNKNLEAEAAKAEATLSALKKEKQQLMDIGLSLDELGEVSQVAQSIAKRYKVTSADLRSKLLQELKNLDKAMGLEVIVAGLNKEMKEQQRTVALAHQEADRLKADIDNLNQEKARQEASLKHTREEVANEIAKIAPSIRESIKQYKKELQVGHDEALVEVRRLRDETVNVGKEIGRLEQIIQTNQWLTSLLSLVRGAEDVEAKQVKVIVLPILRAFETWLKCKGAHDFKSSILLIHLQSLLSEVEKWEV